MVTEQGKLDRYAQVPSPVLVTPTAPGAELVLEGAAVVVVDVVVLAVEGVAVGVAVGVALEGSGAADVKT